MKKQRTLLTECVSQFTPIGKSWYLLFPSRFLRSIHNPFMKDGKMVELVKCYFTSDGMVIKKI